MKRRKNWIYWNDALVFFWFLIQSPHCIAFVWHVLAGDWCGWWKPMFIHIALLLLLYFICWTIVFARIVFGLGGGEATSDQITNMKREKSVAKTKVWCYRKRPKHRERERQREWEKANALTLSTFNNADNNIHTWQI